MTARDGCLLSFSPPRSSECLFRELSLATRMHLVVFAWKWVLPNRYSFLPTVQPVDVFRTQVLTGERPFSDVSSDVEFLMTVATSQSTMQPTRPDLCEPARQMVLDKLWTVILQCLAQSPGDRPSTLSESASLLELVMTASDPDCSLRPLFSESPLPLISPAVIGGNRPRRRKSHQARFVCQTCNLSFIKRENLLDHTRIHLGEKPYHCHECPSAFVQQSDLKRHRVIRHGDRTRRVAPVEPFVV
ncbi:hypothetical protein JAAARDRAFT_438072 [Jaapia argillacea MUCL 33604]|uniref:C2H2-type domain-containing protein n=1 Tax=Jaapia argillacea MUCL 33604 TaxID=933084 RepID=A0A067PPI6_9AGAM|nr:hypothetical protein JAAARDRAFT_438072 [Jaapia argillacea MUCL 33604]